VVVVVVDLTDIQDHEQLVLQELLLPLTVDYTVVVVEHDLVGLAVCSGQVATVL
jgi:hypothetical protein